ncbi:MULTISPECIES: DMT family transporter [unclassified Rathayibacter]|uniref:DMT family transporter n=1 Tax=unclassified Rathayibacter TaxID=2609250 RepID=UPI001C61363E|nr:MULTISPECIES: DMT family transporter [unclassified Rathayibacter]
MRALFSRFRVDLLLLVVAASWGSTYFAAKELVTDSSVMALLGSRMTLAALCLAVIVAARRHRITAAEWRVGVTIGALLATIFALETYGIAGTSATNAGLIISLTIVITPILDSAVSKRRLPGRFLLACLVAVVGVALLAGNGALRPLSPGDLLILGAAVVRAVHVTSMHRLSARAPMDSLRLTTVQLGTCAVVFSAASLVVGVPIPEYVAGLDPVGAGLFLYLVLVCTVFGFLVQTWAVRRTSPSRVSLLLGTEPVWAAVVGVALARDPIAPVGFLGIALILVGTAWGRSLEQRTAPDVPTAAAAPEALLAPEPEDEQRRPVER